MIRSASLLAETAPAGCVSVAPLVGKLTEGLWRWHWNRVRCLGSWASFLIFLVGLVLLKPLEVNLLAGCILFLLVVGREPCAEQEGYPDSPFKEGAFPSRSEFWLGTW